MVAANRNAAGQIVAAGRLSALDKLAEDPPEKARVRALGVAGAFHTEFMASALDGYSAAAQHIATAEPTSTLLSNRDGQPVSSAADAMEKLVAQLTPAGALGPVLRDAASAQRDRNCRVPAGGSSSGIAKRELRGTPTGAFKTPADLDGLGEL